MIAPLDWGLGHTTRCIPLMRHIAALGHAVTFAGNAHQRSFIEETFRGIDIIHLDGYNIRYSGWNKYWQAGLAWQLPRITGVIKAEHNWLLKIAAEKKIDGIISDNRYGLHHPCIPSVILTHQLQVQTGAGRMADRWIQKIHYHLLGRFGQTWVLDLPGPAGIGGILSHPSLLPARCRYAGLLSRFALPGSEPPEGQPGGKPSLVILLSGPEPQRSRFSRMLWQQLPAYNGKVVFIEGSMEAPAPGYIPANVAWHARLAGRELLQILLESDAIICRSGYSTIMDLLAIGKSAILVPTPGQTEQLYLANHLKQQGIFYSTPQQGFNIRTACAAAERFSHSLFYPEAGYQLYPAIVDEWLDTL